MSEDATGFWFRIPPSSQANPTRIVQALRMLGGLTANAALAKYEASKSDWVHVAVLNYVPSMLPMVRAFDSLISLWKAGDLELEMTREKPAREKPAPDDPFDPLGVGQLTNNVWRHVKRGSTYVVLMRGKMQHANPELDNQDVVVYRELAPEPTTAWVRLTTEFLDGRFVPVEKP